MAQRPLNLQSGSNPAPGFVEETDLALARYGGQIVFATDEWFASADNLLNHEPPIFIADKFTDYGKWMDGWESRRKRIAGHDWCIIKLAFPGRVVGVDVDTSFFTGNYVPRMSIQAICLDDEPAAMTQLLARRQEPHHAKMGTCASQDEIQLAESLGSQDWPHLVPFHPLQAGYEDTCHNYFQVAEADQLPRVTHLRLNMFPDGGIARLRVYGQVDRDWSRIPVHEVVDLAAVEYGGLAVGCSDKHYGHPKNLINPGRGINMGDGWETARKMTRPAILEPDAQGLIKVPGDDWAVLKLGTTGVIKKLEVDTKHFKGNFPESCQVEAALVPQGTVLDSQDFLRKQEAGHIAWKVLLPRTKLSADRQHYFDLGSSGLQSVGPVTHLRLSMYPDGGISRLRAYGTRTDGTSRL